MTGGRRTSAVGRLAAALPLLGLLSREIRQLD